MFRGLRVAMLIIFQSPVLFAAPLRTCETTLKFLKAHFANNPLAKREIANLQQQTASLKGELLDVTNPKDRVIGKADRAVVHRLGLRHRSVVAFVIVKSPGESESRILVQEFYAERPENEVFVIGGHVQAGDTYANSIERDIGEELGFEESHKLEGNITQIDQDGAFELNGLNGDSNFERLSLYI